MDEIELGLWWLNHRERIKVWLKWLLIIGVSVIWVFFIWQFFLFVWQPGGQSMIERFGNEKIVTIRPKEASIQISYAGVDKKGDAIIYVKNENSFYNLAELLLRRGQVTKVWQVSAMRERFIAWPSTDLEIGEVVIDGVKWAKTDISDRVRTEGPLLENFKLEKVLGQSIVSGEIINNSDKEIYKIYLTLMVRQQSRLRVARTLEIVELKEGETRPIKLTLSENITNGDVEVSTYEVVNDF